MSIKCDYTLYYNVMFMILFTGNIPQCVFLSKTYRKNVLRKFMLLA